MDITESTLASVASDIGVSKTVSQMSEIEKRLLRIIALQRQMQEIGATGDLADTIESTSNQLKVMKEQLKEVGTWIGNVFSKAINKVLPYINGFIMALKEVIQLVAIFFGYEETTSVSSDPLGVGDTTDEVDSLTSSIEDASSAVDKYNKKLMGFDVLNVISSPSDSGSSSSSGVSGVDPAILASLEDYDSMMDSVRMKANDIRDKILSWIGLTEDANGQLTFSADTLKNNLVKWWESLNAQAKLFIAIGVGTALYKVWQIVVKLGKAIGNSALFSPLKKLFNLIKENNENIQDHATLLSKIESGYTKWMDNMRTNKLEALKTALTGILTALIGITTLTTAIQDISENGANLLNVLEAIAGAALTAIGVFETLSAVVAAFGTEATISTAGLSLLIGALVAGGVALVSWLSHKSDLEEFNEELEKAKDTANDNAIANVAEEEATRELVAELDNYIDANGKINEQYKDRVEFILTKLNKAYGTEYKLSENLEIKNGDIVQSYEDIATSIEKVSTKLKAKAILEAKYDMYVDALKSNITLNKQIKETQQSINKTREEYNTQVSLGKITEEKAQEAFENSIASRKKNLEDLLTEYKANDEIIQDYSNIEYAIETENSDKMTAIVKNNLGDISSSYSSTYTAISEKVTGELTNSQQKAIETWNKTTGQNIQTLSGFYDSVYKISSKTGASVKQVMEEAGVQVDNGVNKWKSYLDNANLKIKVDTEITNISETAKAAASSFSSYFKGYLTLPSVGITDSNGNKVSSSVMKFKTYATGGLPDIGQMFIAREAGPELVGNVGNTSAVMNNEQIVEAVSRGVASAVSKVLGNNETNIYLDSREIANVITNRQNRNLARVGA